MNPTTDVFEQRVAKLEGGVGALALAYMFAAMSRRLPADGGPYAYARVAFGNPTGFANAWSYWITAWAGNAAIVVLAASLTLCADTSHARAQLFPDGSRVLAYWLPGNYDALPGNALPGDGPHLALELLVVHGTRSRESASSSARRARSA